MGKLGTLEAVVYFVNYEDPAHEKGYILMAPYTGCPEPRGYRREYADNLPAVRRLEKILQRQEYLAGERDAIADRSLSAPGKESVRDRLVARMVSSSTTEYEKEFIRLYLQVRDDRAAKHE